MVGAVKKHVLHRRTKFRKDRPNRCGDIAICVIFKIVAAAILDFQKFTILTVDPLKRANACHQAKFHQNGSKRSQRYGDLTVLFKNGGGTPSWVYWVPIGTTHDDHLMVSIVLPNSVKIDAVVSIIWNFQYFARLAWKRLFTPQNWCFRWISRPKWGAISTKPPKAHPCAIPRRLSHQAWKFVDGSDL